jgi:2-alkenal reductase
MSLKRVIYVLFVILVAGASALAGVIGGGFAVYTALQNASPAAPATNLPSITAAAPQKNSSPVTNVQVATVNIETSITDAVAKVGPAVVTVDATLPGEISPFGDTGSQEVSGSGVIISNSGYILTNNHVVSGAQSVSVILANGTQLTAKIVGTDQYSDLAVLQATGSMPAVALLGNSDTLKPGETVIAIGSPLGDFKNTVTVGVVSATGRSLDTGQGYSLEGLIQTDAAINHGNSGGPLVNLAGQVVAINTLIVRNSGSSGDVAEGLGFAIPSNTVQAVSEQLVSQGRVSRPYLGIANWQWITSDIADAYNLPVQWGVYVSQVDPGSPAQAAGIRRGDIIFSIGTITLDNDHPYYNSLFKYKPGQTIPLGVQRGNQKLTIKVTLTENNNGS